MENTLPAGPSAREALVDAFDKLEAGTLEHIEPVEIEADQPVETAEAKAGRERDDKGRFAQKAEPAQPVEAEPVTTKRAAPSSWKKDYWQSWEKIDPTVQAYIEQREEESRRGVESLKTQYDQVAPLHKALQPFLPTLQQRGVSPDRWLQDLGYVDRVLTTGSPQEKAQLIYRMAVANGVPFQPQQGQGDPQLQYLLQTVNGLQSKVQSFESLQAQTEQQGLQAQITQFAADKPHFPAVKNTMGQLLQSGVADSLQTAYDKAIRLHDDIWQEMQAQQASSVNRQADIARKKAAASSPRSASPTGATATGNGKDVRSAISAAWDQHMGGRV